MVIFNNVFKIQSILLPSFPFDSCGEVLAKTEGTDQPARPGFFDLLVELVDFGLLVAPRFTGEAETVIARVLGFRWANELTPSKLEY